MRLFSLIYNGFVWGLLVAVVAINSQWLDMRFSVGLLIPVVVVLAVIAGLIWKKPLNLSVRFTTVNLLISLSLAFLVLGAQRMTVVPAAIIREAVKITDVGFPTINLVLIVCLIIGLAAIGIWKPGKKY